MQPTYLDPLPFEGVNSVDASSIGINPSILDNWSEWTNFGYSKALPTESSGELSGESSGESSGANSLADDFQFYSITSPLVFGSMAKTSIGEECAVETQAPSPAQSPAQSPTTSKHSSVDMVTPLPPKWRRGSRRPQDHQSFSSDFMESKDRPNKRIPHNEVERKYRDGLNAQMERLRLAVPSLTQFDPQTLDGPPKPSKVMVLANAVDYIRRIENERDRLLLENQLLRG